jgi:acetyl-CoA synthetase
MLGKEWNAVVGGNLVVPATFNFAADVLAPRARETPDHTAIISLGDGGKEDVWTYARAYEAVCGLASGLAERGVKRGDRVLIFMPRTAYWLVAMAACHYIGAIPVPSVTQISVSEVSYRVRRSGAVAAITSSELVDRFTEVLEELPLRICRGSAEGWLSLEDVLLSSPAAVAPAAMEADAPALMYFTSGSSGLPKAVVHAARGVFVRSWQPWHMFDASCQDVIWTTSDTGWTRAGSCLLYGAWFWGATALIVEPNLSAQEKVDVLDRYSVTMYSAVSTELRQILSTANKVDLPKLKFTLSAGEAMTVDLSQRWAEFSGAPLLVAFGQTETPQCTITAPDAVSRNGSIGRAMPGNVVAVVDSEDRLCAAGEVGELAVRGDNPGLMLGYWAEGAVVPAFSKDGWHRTGDSALIDENGDLFFIGRSDDIISSSGYRIGPTEVENALMGHPAVKECAVTSAPDELRGEVVKAYIVLQSDAEPSEQLAAAIQRHVKDVIAPYKYPRQIEFLSELPKTASGKISRRLLREGAAATNVTP